MTKQNKNRKEQATLEQMAGSGSQIVADDAWECGDYKEMINLMAELICRLQ